MSSYTWYPGISVNNKLISFFLSRRNLINIILSLISHTNNYTVDKAGRVLSVIRENDGGIIWNSANFVCANWFLKREHFVIASACFKGSAVIYESRACARSPGTLSVLCPSMIPRWSFEVPWLQYPAAHGAKIWRVEYGYHSVQSRLLSNNSFLLLDRHGLFRVAYVFFFCVTSMFLLSIRWFLIIKKSVFLCLATVAQLFPLRNNALSKNVRASSIETLDLVDFRFIIGFRMIKDRSWKEQ